MSDPTFVALHDIARSLRTIAECLQKLANPSLAVPPATQAENGAYGEWWRASNAWLYPPPPTRKNE